MLQPWVEQTYCITHDLTDLKIFFFQNRKTGYKKKLNSFIQFPDILDMKDHVKNGCIGKQIYINYMKNVRSTTMYQGHVFL